MIRVLAAGDRFIRSARLRASLERAVDSPVDIDELEFAWPDEPFGPVGEVDEAAGSEQQLIEALDGKNVIVTQLAPLTERVIRASASLQCIAVSRGGPTNVNLDAARARGIRVANVPGRNGIATAEMTLGLMFALLRGIPAAHNSLLEHTWRGDLYREDVVGDEVAGSTIGLLGAGAVGSHVARVLHAMGARVVVFDPYATDPTLLDVVDLVSEPEDVFRVADLVSVHARLTAETTHIVNAQRLALMRPGALLVNSARGGLVDYDAVAASLAAGHLGGAAFDVFADEPANFSHPLFDLAAGGANVVLTPHIAGASIPTAQRAADGVAEEVRRFAAGLPALHPLVEGSFRVDS